MNEPLKLQAGAAQGRVGRGETMFQRKEGLCTAETLTGRPGSCRFQKSHWQKIRTMVNLPVMSPFKKRYAWVQLAGHTGEHGAVAGAGGGGREEGT